ncbi:hypothetical protein [Rhizobium sp. BK176]|uniref:hypothetical protein n=1 Tax=Rhizobium sp. BK176 TaxID=2587071 RepID=UPI00216A651B|nr:hypothetical protein [Rhizobium sp. BK176]MCS4089273.1 hypothetical protein [Rhizobium sp. BK176]
MVDRLETWKSIVQGLQRIEDAVDLIEGVELEEDDLEIQLLAIRSSLKDIRNAAHDFIRPDRD